MRPHMCHVQACHGFALCFAPKTKRKKKNIGEILAEETVGHVWSCKKDSTSDLLVRSQTANLAMPPYVQPQWHSNLIYYPTIYHICILEKLCGWIHVGWTRCNLKLKRMCRPNQMCVQNMIKTLLPASSQRRSIFTQASLQMPSKLPHLSSLNCKTDVCLLLLWCLQLVLVPTKTQHRLKCLCL